MGIHRPASVGVEVFVFLSFSYSVRNPISDSSESLFVFVLFKKKIKKID